MSQDPPSSPDELGLPLKPRPTLANLGKANTELNLWSLDEQDFGVTPPAPRATSNLVPVRRPMEVEELRVEDFSSKVNPIEKVEKLETGLLKAAPSGGSPVKVKTASSVGQEFDDLEHWEDSEIPDSSDQKAKSLISETEPLPPATMVTQTEATNEELAPVQVPAAVIPVKDTLTPLKGAVSMSKLEKMGLISLFAALLLGGGGFLIFSIHGLPTEPERVMENDFPIKGERLEIKSASTYWRPPVTTGDNPDTFRRGTVFLPVIKLTAGAGSAALRIVYRNQDGELIGDVQTRTLSTGEVLEIPSTAGFDDAGMHAAYRTGESKPWTISVSEAASANAASNAFKKLFEINISTDLR